jgi:PAS domain S-box-containing protein
MAALKQVLDSQRSLTTEYRLRNRQGRYVWLETVSNFVFRSDGSLEGILFTGRDSSERKKTTEALRSSERRYEVLINSLDAMVWLIDPQTSKGVYVSAQSERLLGYKPETIISQDDFWREHVHAEDFDRVAEMNLKALTARSTQVEYRFIRPDGNMIWLYDNVSVLEEPDRPTLLIGVSEDVTARKTAERALE